jgi:hypothetical protein
MIPEEVEDAIGKASFVAKFRGGLCKENERDERLLRFTVVAIRLHMDKRSDEERFAELIEKARAGDIEAHGCLCFVAGHQLKAAKELPPSIRDYISSSLIERSLADVPKRGKGRPQQYENRDHFIASTVNGLISEHPGLHATRNREVSRRSRLSGKSTRAESACSIVQKILERLGIHMTEAGVEKIWRARQNRGSSLVRP